MSETRSLSQACMSCPGPAKRLSMVRGMCHACYRVARLRVKAGDETWLGLANRGLCTKTPEEKGHRRGSLFEDKRRVHFGGAS